MTTEKKEREAGSERERILALRQAFVNGAFEMAYRQSAANSIEAWARLGEFHALADKAYPLPKVTRPRVVRDPHGRDGFDQVWRVRNGMIEWANHPNSATWAEADLSGFATERPENCCVVTPARIKLWAELLENPTETVEAE